MINLQLHAKPLQIRYFLKNQNLLFKLQLSDNITQSNSFIGQILYSFILSGHRRERETTVVLNSLEQ